MAGPTSPVSELADQKAKMDAQQATMALQRLLESQNPDPLDVVALDKIINPQKYDEGLFGMRGFAGLMGGGKLEKINDTSEEGVLHSRAWSIEREDLANNTEYQQIEDRIDELREQAQQNGTSVSDNPEFEELFQRRQDIADGTRIIAMHKAEQELGITHGQASNERGSGEHLLREHPEIADFSKSSPEYVQAALEASTTTNMDGQALSADATQALEEAQQTLRSAMDDLERVKADPAASPEALANANVNAVYAYDMLQDLQWDNKVSPDYIEAEQRIREAKAAQPEAEAAEPSRKATEATPVTPSAFDTLDRGATAAQGDNSMIAELASMGAIAAGLANNGTAIDAGVQANRDVALQTPQM